jgi:WD40 repeat protein
VCGNTIATCGYDYTAKLWTKEGMFIRSLAGHQEYGVYSVIFSADDKFILTTGLDKTARVWNMQGQEISVLKIDEIPRTGKFSHDNKYILTISRNNSAAIWKLNGSIVQKFNEAMYVDIANNCYIVVVAGLDFTLLIFEIETVNETNSVPVLKTEKFPCKFEILKFSNDSKYLTAVTEQNNFYLWSVNITDGIKINLISSVKAHDGKINSINFSEDSKLIVTATSDNNAKIWDLRGLLKAVLTGHSNILNDAEFSINNKYVVTCGNDYSVKVWDVNGHCLQTITAHNASVVKSKFSPDGNYILTASNDQTSLLLPWKVEDVFNKINVEKVRGEVWEMSEKDKEVYGIK